MTATSFCWVRVALGMQTFHVCQFFHGCASRGPAATRAPSAHPPAGRPIAPLPEYLLTDDTRARWSQYAPLARAFLDRIDLKWEPIRRAVPTTLAPLLGFELLALGPEGEPFPVLADRARALGIQRVDLELAAFLRAMRSIPEVREHLRRVMGLRDADALLMNVNVDRSLLRGDDFPALIRHIGRDDATVYEINEQIRAEDLPTIFRLAETYRLKLALDDSDQMIVGVRDALLDRAALVKLDHLVTRSELSRFDTSPIAGDQPLIPRVQRLGSRERRCPLVIEGIEGQWELDYLENNWPADAGPVYVQGWGICLPKDLEPLLKPLNTPALPKGYRFVAHARL